METATRTALLATLACEICACDEPRRPAGVIAPEVTPSASHSLGKNEREPPTPAARVTVTSGPTRSEVAEPSEPKIEKSLEGDFRGGGLESRVLILDNTHLVHSWREDGVERREPITTRIPPGERECKVLDAASSQDFLVCMYWFTGPGGGRVDGVLFDLGRRTRGEFFSAAINWQLPMTLCFPDTALGPLPSFTMLEWSTEPAGPGKDAAIVVKVHEEGWSAAEAKRLRKLPSTQKFCECAGAEQCAGEPKAPTATSTIVYRLSAGQLHPTQPSRKVLGEIASQWGHDARMEAWNLAMRGY